MVAARSKWRMSEDVTQPIGLIGPNAVLQLLPVIERLGGVERVAQMLVRAGLITAPDGTQMIPETDAARLHQLLRQEEPDLAPTLQAEAGRRTADYILANRIPRPVQAALRLLPPRPAARLLSQAIARHAWTFAGSGQFHALDPWTFEIAHNPLIRGEVSTTCLCHWHVAVFARLYGVLVSPRCRCEETCCAAQPGVDRCRFVIQMV